MKKDSIHQIRWPAHTFGTCRVRHEDKLVYVNIPKNATAWTKQIFCGQEHNFINEPLPDDYQYLVILRDPHKRVVSGICEWLQRYTPIKPNNPILDNPDVITLLLGTGGTHDEHTELQCRFIEGIPIQRTTFFKCDETLEENFKDWAEKNCPTLLSKFAKANKHQTVRHWKDRLDNLENLINTTPVLAERIKDQIKIDQLVYDSVQYYIKKN